ncbi:terpenoid cyclases/Protein prenyltransferase [Xylaria intraflava]|nr:terpenoid cyclases/Protein prenyltransferase [Xylaria intraflava]
MQRRTGLARARQRSTPHKRRLIPASGSSVSHEESGMAYSSSSPGPEAPLVPDVFTTRPPIRDTLVTDTLIRQYEVEDSCMPFLAGLEDFAVNSHGVPSLRRKRHIKFLEKHLGSLPAAFRSADASRPWIFYWCLNGLAILGADVSRYRDGLVQTARSIQNESGGFGGGPGQQSHLANTYAMVLALTIVGGESAYQVIDRRAMWKWLCALKQPDGSFRMSLGGEIDVRGAYCAAVLITILKLPLDLPRDSCSAMPEHSNLFTGLAEYVRHCQTFEGGISARPGAEAHGAYAFCALGCLAILDAPHRSFPRYLDMPRLMSWLSSRQYAPEGGLGGRTNKLVDGCYSHWVGGCWPLIEAAIQGPATAANADSPSPNIECLYSREGLIRYIMSCGQDQSKRGGMRDKPSAPSDAYHTCYVLSGLSSAQHTTQVLPPDTDEVTMPWTYRVIPRLGEVQVYDEEDRVKPTDPVFVIPEERRKEIMSYFSARPGF